MTTLNLSIDKVLDFISYEEIYSFQSQINQHHQAIIKKTGKGNDFLGWVNWPTKINRDILTRIEMDAQRIKDFAEILVVVGIGGSYLGARAVIDALSHNFAELLHTRGNPLILYAGQNIGEDYLADLLEILDKKDYGICVISKSGTTTEPAIAFRILKNHLEGKYGKTGAGKRIIAITDKKKGALKELAKNEGYTTYVVPDDIGGRYSVLTPVGLLPIAAAGFDIKKLLEGAGDMQECLFSNVSIDKNPAALYAATRNALYQKGKTTEIMVSYQPNLYYFIEWWKQLFGESEGKENKGIFPAGVNFTTDLHSMGQYIQEGKRNIFETVISFEKTKKELLIPSNEENPDNINYIAGRKIHEVNQMAKIATMLAHVDGGVPNISISLPELNEYSLGQLIYFFEMACALSGYILDINPFDQPGVEAYKKNMFALLGKPGFEKETEKIKKKFVF